MACGVCARSTRRAASLPGEGSTHLRGCGITAVGTDAKCAMSAIWSLSAGKRTSRTSRFVDAEVIRGGPLLEVAWRAR
jgi:hypothetical protein